MEFLTTQQKKKKAQRLYFGYALLAVLVVLATYVLISTALGFEIFSTKGTVVQNGLLFIDSRQDGAEIYLNGKKESNNTNAKLTLPESNYDIQLKKTGFREWKGMVSLVGGTVEFLTYPRLLPNEPELLKSRVVPSSPSVLQSRDKRWVASYYPQSPTTLEITDLDNPDDSIVTLAIPATVTGSKAVQNLTFIEWAGDNEHFMVAIKLADTPAQQYVIMNRQKPEDVTNISSTYTLGVNDTVGFWDAKRDRIYIRQETGAIILGSLKDKSLSSQPLFTDLTVEFFPISKERALYTTKVGQDLVVRYYNDAKTYTIATAKDATKPVIAKSFGFNRNDYILVAGEGFDKTLIYRNFENAVSESESGRVAPFYTMPARSTIADTSRSNRFVMGSDGTNAQIYDIEEKELHRYELPAARPATIGWFDDVRLFTIGTDRKLNVFDFTGENVYDLASPVYSLPLVNASVNRMSYITGESNALTSTIYDIEKPAPIN